jgi:ectoine hydroxylase-related dioxygenase (phytanoyl-CoA dioxygenase family)
MNDEQKYLFDLKGYIVCKGVVPLDIIDSSRKLVDQLLDMDPKDLTHPVRQFNEIETENSKSERYGISNILEADPAFHYFVDIPEVIDIVDNVSGYDTYRLNHTYSIKSKGSGVYTSFHFNGTPIVPPASYRYHNGQIISTLTKAVFPLLDCHEEDGCFAVIPSSHKSNFKRPFGDHHHPRMSPKVEPIPANAGDCIIFSEALSHGSVVNTSGRTRSTLYYCYSIGWMKDWGRNLRFSENILESLSKERADIVKLKNPGINY